MRKVLQDDREGSAAQSKVIILLLLQVYRHLQDRRQVRLSLTNLINLIRTEHPGRSWTFKQLHRKLCSLCQTCLFFRGMMEKVISAFLSVTWLVSCAGSSVCCQVMQAGWESFGGVASATMTFSCERTIPQSRATEMAVNMLSPCREKTGSELWTLQSQRKTAGGAAFTSHHQRADVGLS